MSAGMMEEQSSRILINLIKELQGLCLTNMEYFQSGTQSHHAKFHVAFCLLYEYLDIGIEPCVLALLPRLNEYDFSPQTKGNGYRSLLRIVQKCCLSLVQLSRHITVNRDSMLFRRAYYLKELEAYVQTVGQLRACLYYAQQVMNYCQEGCLFADEETIDNKVADKLMMEFELLNQDCFYGRCLGFQFCESMQRPLQMVAIAMASFSEGYQETSQFMQLASTVFNSGKYILNPELRGKQVVNVTRSADVKFCKAFWGLPDSEFLQQLPSLVCPAVEVDEVLQLGPDSFEMMLEDGTDTVIITPPCAHTGPSPVKVRLISYNLRDGQQVHMKPNTKNKSGKPQIAKPKSPGLLVHCHGGGFVAQSSKTHEVYLRHWARDIGVPILSIDYSLAPEFPFPRALEECFYAYSWALQNYEKLGSTGKTILLAGDSAGGNLMISTAMRAASFGIRPPDGLLTVYPVVLARYTPSPARLMALMDPLLPVGILSRCLAAYAGVSDEMINGITDPVFNSDAPFRLDEDEDSSDTEWVVVSDKRGKKHLINVEDEVSPDYFSSPMTTSASDEFVSAPQTPLLSDDISLTTDSMTTITNDDPGTNIDHQNLDSDSAQLCDIQINSVAQNSVIPYPELPPLCDVSDDPNLNICLAEVTSAKGEKNCDKQTSELPDAERLENVDLDDDLESSEELVILELPAPGSQGESSKATSDPTGLSEQIASSSISCPDLIDVPHSYLNGAVTESDINSKSNITKVKSSLKLPLPRTRSVPSFQENRPPPGSMSPSDFSRHRSISNSPLKAVRSIPIVKNPYMSPLLAPDELLKGLPDMCIVGCHLDPLLDDSVMFAKKLKKLGKKVELELIDDLPHGFLNFSMASKDAKRASDHISAKLKDMFKMDYVTPKTNTPI